MLCFSNGLGVLGSQLEPFRSARSFHQFDLLLYNPFLAVNTTLYLSCFLPWSLSFLGFESFLRDKAVTHCKLLSLEWAGYTWDQAKKLVLMTLGLYLSKHYVWQIQQFAFLPPASLPFYHNVLLCNACVKHVAFFIPASLFLCITWPHYPSEPHSFTFRTLALRQMTTSALSAQKHDNEDVP